MSRISIKIVGASGQGLNSIGAIVAKGLKRSGYCVFGYREYPALIKGGHASDQLDVSNERVRSTETKVNVLVALNHHGLELNMEELKEGGIVLHVTPGWQFPERHQKLIKERSIRVLYFPADETLTRLAGRQFCQMFCLLHSSGPCLIRRSMPSSPSSERNLRKRKLCSNST